MEDGPLSENPSRSDKIPDNQPAQIPVNPDPAPQLRSEPALEPKAGLAEDIKARCGEDVSRCYQCLKCSAGCPMTFAMDYPPSQIMRLVQLGQEEQLLASRTIWVCLTCNTCSIRCPNGIDIALVIDSLRERALQQGVGAAVEQVPLFHKYFLNNVRKYGRTFESELLTRYQLKTGQAMSNAALGLRMFLKGRMALLPDSVENKKAFREICRRVAERGGHR